MLDFSKINGFTQGQRQSFEELVCQLARRESMPEGSIFKRVDGAGGDGGVEAYWTKQDGRKVGYQAKFFLSTAGIDWAQVKKSVTQAILSHPELSHFIIAIPCDLTDRSGEKRKGKTGWEHWEDKTAEWQILAADKGISDIQFKVWSQSELLHRIIDADAKGLQEYFFGNVELSYQWFVERAEEAIASLGERFHPEDHVHLEIESLFSILVRNNDAKKILLDAVERVILNTPVSFFKQLGDKFEFEYSAIAALERQIESFKSICENIALDPQYAWDLALWKSHSAELKKANNAFDEVLRNYRQSLTTDEYEKNRYFLDQCNRAATHFYDAFRKFEGLINSSAIDAEKSKFVLIEGNAGSGKSHLLAKGLTNALEKNQPAVLLPGHRLNNTNFWQQVSGFLNLQISTADEILGALDAAGKAAGVRALLMIDAINEGVGSRYWFQELLPLIRQVNRYSHIACIVSCRSEYVEHAVPNEVLNDLPSVTVRGFTSPSEHEAAARVYLDRRGIARPSTPWLAPEYSNPLFLRSVCLSLEKSNRSEFPVGLSGFSATMKFYLDCLADDTSRTLGLGSSISNNFGRALVSIAGKMIEAKIDYLDMQECRNLLATQFNGIEIRVDWLTLFQQNGLLRLDPNPNKKGVFDDDDVVRFSFQRFQDYLMAENILQKLDDSSSIFQAGGALAFCLDDDQIAWEWHGMISALAIAIPEKFSEELVDLLPGGVKKWWDSWGIQQSFADSVRWRKSNSITNRTKELINKLGYNDLNSFDLLIQTATLIDHPLNADYLYNQLIELSISERDAMWTMPLNFREVNYGSVGTLIDWCLHGQVENTNEENQRLAAIVLCWFLTSSNREIRDHSTKALSRILILRPHLFIELWNKFHQINDLYVSERLLAAAYGACCIDPTKERLNTYAKFIYNDYFAQNAPPLNLLLRDYALGIIELAQYLKVLPEDIAIANCKPPYTSTAPDFNETEETVSLLADKAGSKKILFSASGFGDFARYEVEPRLKRCTLVAKEVSVSNNKGDIFSIDIGKAKYWIAAKAYKFGWNSEQFQHENIDRHSFRDKPVIERIGKKYQWLALSELLCRLTDNYWLSGLYDEEPKLYESPLDLSFYRDIEPTILSSKDLVKTFYESDHWAFQPSLKLPDISEEDLLKWPFQEQGYRYLHELPTRLDLDGNEWLVLYEWQSKKEKYQESGSTFEHNVRMDEFRKLSSYLVKFDESVTISSKSNPLKEFAVSWNDQPEETDTFYFLESPWRENSNSIDWHADNFGFKSEPEVAYLATNYRWERHLDSSLPDGASCYMPSIWLLHFLKLKPHSLEFGAWVDSEGQTILQQFQQKGGSEVCVIKLSCLERFLNKNIFILSLLITEKNAYPGGNSSKSSWRKTDGKYLLDSDGKKIHNFKNYDTKM